MYLQWLIDDKGEKNNESILKFTHFSFSLKIFKLLI